MHNRKAIENLFTHAISCIDQGSKKLPRGPVLEGITSSLAKPTQLRRDAKPRPRSEAHRGMLVYVALRPSAQRGYSAARVQDIATQLGISLGSLFQHFKNTDALF